MLTSTICSIGSSLLKEPFIFLTCMGLSIFFNLNPYFLANSELITKPVTPLSNNASTITPSCVSILFNPIFTITSLSMSPLSRLQQDIFALISIANLLEFNQRLLNPLPLLNYFVHYCHHILVFFLL